jgi:hypothetical protein
MKRLLSAAILATAASVVLPGAAGAQSFCPEGFSPSGQCSNTTIPQVLQQIGIIFSHSQISQQHYPLLPNGDPHYRYPNQLIPNPLVPSHTGTPVPPPPPPPIP